MYLTKETLQAAGIDPEKIRRLAELFQDGPGEVTEEKFQEAGFDHEDIIRAVEIILGPRMRVEKAYLTKEKLEHTLIDPEIIKKFAELFPDGTEVTREVRETFPDIFSFGKGADLCALNTNTNCNLCSPYMK